MKVILIRFGELTLKGKNRKEFERILFNNLRKQLEDFEVRLKKDRNRIYVYDVLESDFESIKDAIKCIAGISSFSIAVSCELSMESIIETAINNFSPENGSFKVETKRSNKDFITPSPEVSNKVGSALLKFYDKKTHVDVKKPEQVIRIEIQNENSYIYYETIKGFGGLPVGSSGRGIVLLSGGIDSPVAAIRAMKRGLKIRCIHFSSPPYTSKQSLDKVLSLLSVLHKFDKEIVLLDVEFTKLQVEIHQKCDERYGVSILRRMMFRQAQYLAKRFNATCLVTGECLGQVASQTTQSMIVTHDATDMLILQPLICEDKQDIIKEAMMYNTYEISILPYDDCCVVFLPRNPIIKPKLKDVINEENKLQFKELLKETVSNSYSYDIIKSKQNSLDKFL